eukprot:TRINITY_DN2300_c0_g1_i1.p1 TRINITY_DN2300_c0_g1~~TRINITY_DN2300_c0_g1_i1.p1  ORF type:complete len:288 (-),score=109.56 TRINITY_DN2300_c0_g1_i1:263-1126(-)
MFHSEEDGGISSLEDHPMGFTAKDYASRLLFSKSCLSFRIIWTLLCIILLIYGVVWWNAGVVSLLFALNVLVMFGWIVDILLTAFTVTKQEFWKNGWNKVDAFSWVLCCLVCFGWIFIGDSKSTETWQFLFISIDAIASFRFLASNRKGLLLLLRSSGGNGLSFLHDVVFDDEDEDDDDDDDEDDDGMLRTQRSQSLSDEMHDSPRTPDSGIASTEDDQEDQEEEEEIIRKDHAKTEAGAEIDMEICKNDGDEEEDDEKDEKTFDMEEDRMHHIMQSLDDMRDNGAD